MGRKKLYNNEDEKKQASKVNYEKFKVKNENYFKEYYQRHKEEILKKKHDDYLNKKNNPQ